MPFDMLIVTAQAGGIPEAVVQLAPLLIIFAIFYFLLIAPARKRQKALQTMIDNLKKGDRVVLNGGLYGEVVGVRDTTLQLKISENVKVKVAKSAVAGMEGDEPEGGAA